jgi:hypothetical protein
VISVGAIIQRSHVTIGLVILNYALLMDAIGILVIGTFVWFFTLQERANLHKLWLNATPATRLTLQDKVGVVFKKTFDRSNLCIPLQFKCCGYFNGTDLAEIGGFCESQDFINGLDPSVATNFCVTPVTGFADSTLNNVFT